jgi:hypothetical protein
MHPITKVFSSLLICLIAGVTAASPEKVIVSEQPTAGSFPIVAGGHAVPILTSLGDAKVVQIAAAALAEDIAQVAGVKPVIGQETSGRQAIILGTIEGNPLLAKLGQEGRIDLGKIRGRWESYLIATVEKPLADLDRALVIVGSDRRGAAYGAFALSERIGVSPWNFWADVPPRRKQAIYLQGACWSGPPAVKYRGIFLNDEDWGLCNSYLGPPESASVSATAERWLSWELPSFFTASVGTKKWTGGPKIPLFSPAAPFHGDPNFSGIILVVGEFSW